LLIISEELPDRPMQLLKFYSVFFLNLRIKNFYRIGFCCENEEIGRLEDSLDLVNRKEIGLRHCCERVRYRVLILVACKAE
jgi:hypothetical protein